MMTKSELPTEPTPTLPKGIWYDAPRKRWRVRLYEGKEIRHLSYHRSLDEAIQAYNVAKNVFSEQALSCAQTLLTELV